MKNKQYTTREIAVERYKIWSCILVLDRETSGCDVCLFPNRNFQFGCVHMLIELGLVHFIQVCYLLNPKIIIIITLVWTWTWTWMWMWFVVVVCYLDLEEVGLPLKEYASLKDFAIRRLKDGARPINSDPHTLVGLIFIYLYL